MAPQQAPTTVTREQLFEQVWNTSIRQLAKTYGISDVGLGKACERHQVPCPPVGYCQEGGGQGTQSELDHWLDWAFSVAERFDPLLKGPATPSRPVVKPTTGAIAHPGLYCTFASPQLCPLRVRHGKATGLR